MVANC
jgi:hypothetical protein